MGRLENEKIMEFAQSQTVRESNRMQLSRDREEALNELQLKLSNQIRQEREAKDEMERVRQELYLEEQEEMARNMEREEFEEETFRQRMLAKFEHDDRIELMNAAGRRKKQLEPRKAVEALIEERRMSFERQRQAEIAEHQQSLDAQTVRAEIIEEERQRILKEHAGKLAGYMPKGVFRTIDEVKKVGDDTMVERYTRRRRDSDSD